MTLEVYIRSTLLADATIFSHVGNKIFQNYIPQGEVYPAIVFFAVSESPNYCQGGVTTENKMFQFSLLGANKDHLSIIKDRINFVFDNKGGISLTNSRISLITKTGLVEDQFEKESRVHHVAVSYNFKLNY